MTVYINTVSCRACVPALVSGYEPSIASARKCRTARLVPSFISIAFTYRGRGPALSRRAATRLFAVVCVRALPPAAETHEDDRTVTPGPPFLTTVSLSLYDRTIKAITSAWCCSYRSAISKLAAQRPTWE